MQEVKKFSDLQVSNTYEVAGLSDPYNSKYGISYVLQVVNKETNEAIQIWSTNLLAEYISSVCPNSKFTFTVSERDNKKYPVIDGYKKERKFKILY